MTGSLLIDYFRECHSEILDTIGQLVTHETPSHDKPRLDAFAALLAERLTAVGATVEIIGQPERGNHVRAHFVRGNATEKPALVLCHYDTVWPVGALATHPFRVEEGRAYGPGIFDMQSSLALVEYGLRAVRDLDIALPRPITVLMTSDEEIGSGSSRALIEAEARKAAYVLVMESPLPGGVLKTARKGTGTFTVETLGRAAHAGVDPYKGINAIEEMAHQVLAIHALADREAGTTLSVGRIEGGGATNVVPARATAQVDVRSWTQAEADRIAQAMAALPPVLPGAQIVVSGGWNRPPLERSATGALFERVQQIGCTLGVELAEGGT
ncbi:MAG: M20 family metallopeptidase, partial [Caldilinea sp.]